eukprot:TRINITY_DN11704_c0_g2_i2.p1 TRINITY_DN11704_c0_g2~~TRINITY_DN11704_c0_g2_i2.p1  ORF type:complete len:830 (+),score=240.83 TRINITY_DN11704_c0_g2_i2:123-2492(+)
MADEELAKDDDWYCQSCTEKQPSSSATTSKITKPSPASKKKLPKRKTATPKRPRKAAASISPAQTSSKSGKEKSQSAMTAVKAEAKAEAQAEGIVVVDGTCTFCNQHGNVITCYTCSKAYHLLCAQVELDELAKMAAWHCAKCVSKMPKPEKDKEEDTAALQALLRKVDVARVASGRSLSNSIRRKVGEQRKAGKVAGPTSALSSFLREKGIKAPPRGARWERSRRSEGAPADDDDDDAAVPDRALATSQEPELEVMPELTQAATQQRAKRARRATAVAEATRRVESALEGQRAGNESDDLSPSNKGKKGGQPAAKKSKSKKQQAKQASKGKKRQLKRVESSDDDFEDADNNGGDSLPENVGLCGSCGCRLPHGQMICLACRDRQLKGTIAGINRKRGKNKPKAGSLMHQLLGGDVLSLQELCVKLVCKYIEHVDDFGDVGDHVLDRIGQLMCRNRQLNKQTLQPLLPPTRRELKLYDCAELDGVAYRDVYMKCGNLQLLDLHACGQLTNDELGKFADFMPNLTSLCISGAFKVTDDCIASVVSALPQLTEFIYRHTAISGAKLLPALANCKGMQKLELSHVLMLGDEQLQHLHGMHKLEQLKLVSCELLTDDSIVPVLEKVGHKLKTLHLSGLFQLTDASLQAAARHCPSLKDLSVVNLVHLTDAGLAAFVATDHRFTHLNLKRCIELTDEPVAALCKQSKGLVELNCHSLDKLTPSVLDSLVHCQLLKTVDLSFTRSIVLDDDMIQKLCASCTALSSIAAWGCLRITDDAVHYCEQRDIKLSGCSRV